MIKMFSKKVSQVLVFSILGKKKIRMMRVNLIDFVVNCVDYFKSACEGKGIDFRVNVLDQPLAEAVRNNVSLNIRGEPDALEKITFNFLSNALKFTPHGGTITLALNRYDSLLDSETSGILEMVKALY